MGFISLLSRPFAAYVNAKTQFWTKNAALIQQKTFEYLIAKAQNTRFGKDFGFKELKSPAAFNARVPLFEYEDLSAYIQEIIHGKADVLWPGKPLYLSKTSGTTSGVKYIPISKESMPGHIESARNALLSYIHESRNSRFLNGKLIFLSGSPQLDFSHGIATGRLSGIVNHYVPAYLRRNQLPTYNTNIIDDWETKLDHIIAETLPMPMTLISGIPPWVQMYFDKIIKLTGKPIAEVFPQFQLFVYGGVNFAPYRNKLFSSIGKEIPSIETYPASEGFIAYQDSQYEEGLLLLLNNGIFYQFIPTTELASENPVRLGIQDVELGVNYALLMSTNAGLWSYLIGDTVRFVSKNPYKIVVSGRTKHFLSAFGEHVIGEEVEQALYATLQVHRINAIEFTVAPQVNSADGLPYHEWYIEFENLPANPLGFAADLDLAMQSKNIYYKDLIQGHILQKLKINQVQAGGFVNIMRSEGKLGGQNKVPHLANNRNLAQKLDVFSKALNA